MPKEAWYEGHTEQSWKEHKRLMLALRVIVFSILAVAAIVAANIT